jgi:cytochrome c oxidase cbb3-type subunit 1
MSSPPPVFARTVALHSLGWLVAANCVGLWLAISLLRPAVGDALAPLTFGRWTPLHLNWQLYGWCALPIVGVLLAWCLPADDTTASRRHARLALGAWTAALAFGGLAWLGGSVSGKLFLDWHGWTRPLLPLAMLVLWAVLAFHTRRAWPGLATPSRWLRSAVLFSLLAVPAVIFHVTSRRVYHPVNPDSGGATGAAILGSVLGIVGIVMLLPVMLGVPERRSTRSLKITLGVASLAFVVIDHGNTSHHALAQIIALGTLVLWIPLLPLYLFRQDWPEAARPWLRAFSVWWGVLIVTGWISFLPGVSEALKFTHALVGHAHLAMAGLLTSLNGALLTTLLRRPAPRGVFLAWQVGCGIYITAMIALGIGEVHHLADLYRGELWAESLLGVRLFAGLLMTGASLRWLAALVRP